MNTIRMNEKELDKYLFPKNSRLGLSVVFPTLERTLAVHKQIVGLKSSGALQAIEPLYTHEHMYFLPTENAKGKISGSSECEFELRFVHNVQFTSVNRHGADRLHVEFVGNPYVHAYRNGEKCHVEVTLNTGEVYGLPEFIELKRISLLHIIQNDIFVALEQVQGHKLS